MRSGGGSTGAGGTGLRPVAAGAPPGVAFLFPGQGSQAVGMIKEVRDGGSADMSPVLRMWLGVARCALLVRNIACAACM